MSKFIEKIKLKLSEKEDSEVIASKIKNKALTAFASQLAIKEANLIDKTDAVESATLELEEALINGGHLIMDRDVYLANYASSYKKLERAKEDLNSSTKEIKLLKEAMSQIAE